MQKSGQQGLSLIEMLVVVTILAILASAAMPLSRMTVKRAKEIELRAALRTVRNAIDEFKRDCDLKKLSTVEGYCKAEQNYYPESLEQLTEPLKLAAGVDKTKKYLRRIPRDPMASTTSTYSSDKSGWGMRSYTDAPDSTEWGGGNVYDIYSKSDQVALDGTRYSTW